MCDSMCVLQLIHMNFPGIRQEDVSAALEFPAVFNKFNDWFDDLCMEEEVEKEEVTFVTYGDFDLKVALPEQCQTSQLSIPSHLKRWINLKTVNKLIALVRRGRRRRLMNGSYFQEFERITGVDADDLEQMLGFFGRTFEVLGRFHRGMDDCRIMKRILEELCEIGTLQLSAGCPSPSQPDVVNEALRSLTINECAMPPTESTDATPVMEAELAEAEMDLPPNRIDEIFEEPLRSQRERAIRTSCKCGKPHRQRLSEGLCWF